MGEILKIENLCKNYPTFSLKNVSFSIESGQIMGFIGRNGAGKSTTLKSIMKIISYDSGEIFAFGKDMDEFELENKQKIGFSLSELNYYPNATVKKIVDVTKHFYNEFSEEKFNKLASLFNLDVNKKLEALSSGMKVKFSLAIALSHNAKLLILDEPTSGLDPISRDEVLDLFRRIVKEEGRAILFSTHITSDLDKCATGITYIRDGQIEFTGKKDDFINSYLFVPKQEIKNELLNKFVSYKDLDGRYEGLIKASDKQFFEDAGVMIKEPDLEEIMVYLERNENESFTL